MVRVLKRRNRRRRSGEEFASVFFYWRLFVVLHCFEASSRAGVTVVTNGFELGGGHPAWVDQMAKAIASRAGDGTVVLRVDVDETNPIFGHLEVSSINLEQGTLPPDSSWNGEIVIKLFWNAVAGFTDSYSTTDIAEVFAPVVMNPLPAGNQTNSPLVTLPLHFIGHSRGGSLVCELSRRLAQHNIWVDHVTTLDPHPLGLLEGFASDADLVVPENITFIDNYFQTSGLVSGESVPGSSEINLSARGFFGHSDIHEWYLGTITGTNTGLPYWHKTNDFGFELSTIAKGRHLRENISTNYSGSGLRWNGALRTKVPNQTPPIWPNVDVSEPANSFFVIGSTNQFDYRYNGNSRAFVGVAVTTESNPYLTPATDFRSANTYSAINSTNIFADAPSLKIERSFDGANLLCVAIDPENTKLVRYFYADEPLSAEALRFLSIQSNTTNLVFQINGNGHTPFRLEGSTNLLQWKLLGIGSNAFGRVPVHATNPGLFLRAVIDRSAD